MSMKWIRRIIDYTKGEVKRKRLEYYESKLAKLERKLGYSVVFTTRTEEVEA